ncbi:MAG: phenylalanine--tRNA ligase subunit beta [Chloroflexi bacterium]|jgi:phenylalanyl-tRNA synthetase beta chain|nr:phenylalanine--tRNA ligase subunit beta [Chloroflexota bacterium]MBT7081517.1 phenylalanine--tRNA ligase subunit beta [Chloroflexota bacterium]MBT7289002.1 phenylalanine--tRNA ligase subunit beta [Chloroflexota bacterium]
MKVSVNWLKDYVDVSVPADELAHRLTMSGNEVEAVDSVGASWDNVLVGHVLTLEPHPDADRLRLATVELGGEQMTVVCGDPNVKVDDKIVFARVGAKLIDGHNGKARELKPAKIRGIASSGMICSEMELGISESHDGIIVLPADAPIGMPLADYMGDTVLDITVTPNRADCLSVLGVARETAALTGKTMSMPTVEYSELGDDINKSVSVQIDDADLCYRYCASLIKDVKIGPSPEWMQRRLIASGMRPISNIVDITNYVMLEYGQPLHAFDYNKLPGGKITVRRAKDEKLTTIDDVERKITSDMLVIADDSKAIALAGVMGGQSSEVSDNTTSILLECANFNRENVRRTSQAFKMRSEASLRFEKGLSPELALYTLRRATQLIVELAGGVAAKGIVDVYPGRADRLPISLTDVKVKQVLGIDIAQDEMVMVLATLGFGCKVKSKSELLVEVPYWRTDVSLPVDLIEEIARITGYDQIPTTLLSSEIPQNELHPMLTFKDRVRDILVGCGMQEIITYSLVGWQDLAKIGAPDPIGLINPLSTDQQYLRTSLRPSVMMKIADNEKHEPGLSIFEIGRTYLKRDQNLPDEREILCGSLAGQRTQRQWQLRPEHVDFYDAKGVLETLFDSLGVRVNFEACDDATLVSGRTAAIIVDKQVVGVVGQLDPHIAEQYDISSDPVYLFEIKMDKLLPLIRSMGEYSRIARFPGSTRDISLLLDIDVPSSKVQDIIEDTKLVSEVALFDVYTGDKLPSGKKTLAYSIVYQAPDRTLTDKEVNKVQDGMLKRLQKTLAAVLRQ